MELPVEVFEAEGEKQISTPYAHILILLTSPANTPFNTPPLVIILFSTTDLSQATLSIFKDNNLLKYT